MTDSPRGKPLIRTEIVEDGRLRQFGSGHPAGFDAAPGTSDEPEVLLKVEVTEDSSFVTPEPEEDFATTEEGALSTSASGGAGLLAWLLLGGLFAVIVIISIEWVVALIQRTLFLGIPAALGTGAGLFAVAVLVVREISAFRQMKEAGDLRNLWEAADGETLRRLILRVGAELGRLPSAERAADMINDSGPDAARGFIATEVLKDFDKKAASKIVSLSQQGFMAVSASPSPILDSVLLLAQAGRMMREIAAIYGYRPNALTLRAVVLSATRDAGAIALVDLFAQDVAVAAGKAVEEAGGTMTKVGGTLSVLHPAFGLPIQAAGFATSLFGKSVDEAGGQVGTGFAAAWRLYRFGLTALVVLRPVPLSENEKRTIRRRVRSEMARLRRHSKTSVGERAG